MSVIDEKSFELLAIQRELNRFFLQIRFVFEQELELICEIDEMTAKSLHAITTFGTTITYTLSFYSACDYSKTRYISRITRTSFTQSDSVYFACSKEYTQALHLIEHIQHVEDLQTLSFLSIKPLEKEQPEDNIIGARSALSIRKLAWIAACITSIVTIGYLGYMNFSFDDSEPVKAEHANKQIVLTSAMLPSKKQVKIKKTAVPVVKLEETINYSIPKGKVALTFDDGPSKYSKKMIDVLKKYKVGGTFFYVGTRVKQFPEYVEYAKNNGFSIGSHSMSHSLLTKLPIKKQETEITQTNQLIKQITGEPVVLFRPPYGAKNNSIIQLVKKHHSELVLWNIDTEDWKSRNAKIILQSVKKEETSGSIILFHESQATLEALPDIIKYLQKQDLEIVSLQ